MSNTLLIGGVTNLQRKQWIDAAKRDQCTVRDWIFTTLNKAAGELEPVDEECRVGVLGKQYQGVYHTLVFKVTKRRPMTLKRLLLEKPDKIIKGVRPSKQK